MPRLMIRSAATTALIALTFFTAACSDASDNSAPVTTTSPSATQTSAASEPAPTVAYAEIDSCDSTRQAIFKEVWRGKTAVSENAENFHQYAQLAADVTWCDTSTDIPTDMLRVVDTYSRRVLEVQESTDPNTATFMADDMDLDSWGGLTLVLANSKKCTDYIDDPKQFNAPWVESDLELFEQNDCKFISNAGMSLAVRTTS